MRVVTLLLILATTAMASAETLSPEDLARKNENGYVTGLPLAAYSTDIGLGGGARVYYFWNGPRSDKRFSRTPYLHRVFLQGFVSTRGLQFHWLDYDAPKIFDSQFRVRSQLIYLRNINSNYFGQGSAPSENLLSYTGKTQSYDKMDDYLRDQQSVTPGGTTYAKYDQYDLERPIWVWSLERLFLNDRIRVLGGVGFSYARIRDYSQKDVTAFDANGAATTARSESTRLYEDCVEKRKIAYGCDGGWDNYLRFGVSYDTRDFEPDPNNGWYADLAIDAGTKAMGSDYDYVRVLGAVRRYWTPDATSDFVLAGRALLQVQTKGVPFFSMDTIPFTEDPRAGLGGHRTMRGFKQDRFVGRAMSAMTGEARWTFARFKIKAQTFAAILVPFLDIGRSWDGARDIGAHDWRLAYGGAFRLAWNQATIITVDYGRSAEDSGLYINFAHMF